MNFVKKLYCRAFQFCFRIALPILPYREPKILDNMEKAAALLKSKHISRVLIVTDKGITALGILLPLLDQLQDYGIFFEIYDDTVPNPTIKNIEAARVLYLQKRCQAIIGFGGGSSIDCAKITAARIAKPRQSVNKMKGLLRIHHKLPLLIAVPTTAGTGSETTLAAVITDDKTHHKYPINDFCLIPDYAILDPSVTFGLPKHLTATTGMDALTHAVEAYIGGSTTRHTRAMAEEAVTLISTYLLRAYKNGKDSIARDHMLRASYCAGIAFTQSYVGYVHGLAHALGGQYGIPHGLANAVILPHILEEYDSACHKRLAKLARICKIADKNDNPSLAAEKFIQWIKDMNAQMNIPVYIEGICEKDIPVMARHADAECNPLYPVPKLMDASALADMFYKISGRNHETISPLKNKHQTTMSGKVSSL